NYPNPFNAFTTIQYRLPESGRVNLSIFNLEGKKKATLVNGKLPAGFHHVSINATH
ncbi:MAG TPA: T9SS type A sorting domain-containing protein, partial [Bacteroidetes bacterium]|nr:T9SS type A sorting domain-containing protein [Bacteroidota bacterium]